jgi:hypothetical protein
MRAIDFLPEAKGLFGRKPGEVFVDDNGNELTFQTIQMYPSDKANDGFPDAQGLQDAIEQVESQLGSKIAWINRSLSTTKAFAVAQFVDPKGTAHFWGRYYPKVPASLTGTWSNTETPNNAWRLKTKTAAKVRSGLTPQDLIKGESAFTSNQQIITTVSKNIQDPAITAGLEMLAAGKLPVFKGQAANFEAIRDYLGEIMQPMGLKSGVISGDAEKARATILKSSWEQSPVIWPQAKNANLIDSFFRNPATGATVGISSKGAKGADASVANIYAAIAKAREEGNTKLLNTHKAMVDIVTTINNLSAIEGPLQLGTRYNIITPALADEIRGVLKSTKRDTQGLSRAANSLFKRYNSDPSVPGYNVGFVLLANVAKMVADAINADPKFGLSCLAFLNQASIVQVYTNAKVVGEDVQITGFKSVYPPNFKGTVLLNGGKNYYSTRIGGKIAFKYQPY